MSWQPRPARPMRPEQAVAQARQLVIEKVGQSGVGGGSGQQGPTGPQGPAGPKGDTGSQGPAGPALTDASTLTTGTVPDARLPARARYIPFEVAMVLLTAATAPAAASAAANVELFSAAKTTRNRLDLANATQVRLVAMVIANGNLGTAAVKLSYMTTEAATWAGTDAGASIVLGTGTTGTLRDSGWQTLAAGARVDNVTVAALVSSPFGTTAPTISSLTMFVR